MFFENFLQKSSTDVKPRFLPRFRTENEQSTLAEASSGHLLHVLYCLCVDCTNVLWTFILLCNWDLFNG